MMGAGDWRKRPSANECLRENFFVESNSVTNLFANYHNSSKKRDNSLWSLKLMAFYFIFYNKWLNMDKVINDEYKIIKLIGKGHSA
jgi:hypothetical protein